MNNTPQTETEPTPPVNISIAHKVATETRCRRVFDDSTWFDMEGHVIAPGRYREVVRTIEDKWLEPIPQVAGVAGYVETREVVSPSTRAAMQP